MRARHRVSIAFAFLLTGCTLAPVVMVQAADDPIPEEAGMYVITTWETGCPASRRHPWDNMVSAWFEEVRNSDQPPDGHGADAWSRLFGQVHNNDAISDSWFVDPDLQAWGEDDAYADALDALMVGMHGGNNAVDHRWHGLVKWNEAGSGNCYTYQGHTKLGNGDLEFLHLSSCYGMDYEDWWNEWNSTFDGLHQIDGFHGKMWISDSRARSYRRFAEDAFWISIADSWMDHLYETDVNGEWDQCPVVRVVGTDATDSMYRMTTERYNFVLGDPPGLTQSRHHRARYIGGCAPAGKEALPQ